VSLASHRPVLLSRLRLTAIGNDFATDLITRDLGGEMHGQKSSTPRTRLFDAFRLVTANPLMGNAQVMTAKSLGTTPRTGASRRCSSSSEGPAPEFMASIDPPMRGFCPPRPHAATVRRVNGSSHRAEGYSRANVMDLDRLRQLQSSLTVR
jgi:hypothetical protein